MGVVPHGEEPVVNGEPKVVLVQFDECAAQICGLAKRLGKRICLELKPPTQECHSETKYLQWNGAFRREKLDENQRRFKNEQRNMLSKLFKEASQPQWGITRTLLFC